MPATAMIARIRKYGAFLHYGEIPVIAVLEYGDADVENCSFAEVTKMEEFA